MRSAILLPLAITSAAASVPCTSEQACRNAAANANDIMSFTRETRSNFKTSTKGCFTKNGRVFWAPGTYEEMTAEPTPSLQKRVFCDGDSNDMVDLIIEDGSEEMSGGDVKYCMNANECEAVSKLHSYQSFASGDWQTTKVRTMKINRGKESIFPHFLDTRPDR